MQLVKVKRKGMSLNVRHYKSKETKKMRMLLKFLLIYYNYITLFFLSFKIPQKLLDNFIDFLNSKEGLYHEKCNEYFIALAENAINVK